MSLIPNRDLLMYVEEILEKIPELTEAERHNLLLFARNGDHDVVKNLVIELKTKYGYYGGKGGKF